MAKWWIRYKKDRPEIVLRSKSSPWYSAELYKTKKQALCDGSDNLRQVEVIEVAKLKELYQTITRLQFELIHLGGRINKDLRLPTNHFDRIN